MARVPELDGVRAIAIWLVLLFHIFPVSAPAFRRVPAFIKQIVSHGWLGVDLFFVLSGFLITGILLDTKQDPPYFKNFYGRRALRILPVYLLTIGCMWIAYGRFHRFFLLSLGFLSNFNDLLQVPYPLGGTVLWSLAVEEHFYLLWPVLVRFASTRAIVLVSVALIIVEIATRAVCAAHGIDTYQLSWFRFDGLAMGALLAVFVRSAYCTRQNCVKFAVGLIIAIAAVTAATIPYGSLIIKSPVSTSLRFAQAYVCFGSGILLLWAFRSHPMTGVFRSRFARLSADLSYCVYLIHLGVLDGYYFATNAVLDPWLKLRLGDFGAAVVNGVVILTITLFLALLSRKFIEAPAIRLKNRFS
jgi:peptidoglycan/LPS O-acetylase OafA/YrhL